MKDRYDKKLIDINALEIDNLPKGVSISTMCCSAKLNTIINVSNVLKYLQLDSDKLLCVKLSKDDYRSLIKLKFNKKQKNKKPKRGKQQKFYNQVTTIIRISQGNYNILEEEPKINIKLFRNGSIQMSGCKSIKDVNRVINKIISKLSHKVFVDEDNNIVKTNEKVKDKKYTSIKFVEDRRSIKLTDFKIDMINSNYQVNLHIDRNNLYKLLLKKKITASYEKSIRACVIIKYIPQSLNPNNKEISIFVFQKGNIIITGAKSKYHIIEAYEFLNNILVEHIDDIGRDEEKEEKQLLEYFGEVMKENEHKLDQLIDAPPLVID